MSQPLLKKMTYQRVSDLSTVSLRGPNSIPLFPSLPSLFFYPSVSSPSFPFFFFFRPMPSLFLCNRWRTWHYQGQRSIQNFVKGSNSISLPPFPSLSFLFFLSNCTGSGRTLSTICTLLHIWIYKSVQIVSLSHCAREASACSGARRAKCGETGRRLALAFSQLMTGDPRIRRGRGGSHVHSLHSDANFVKPWSQLPYTTPIRVCTRTSQALHKM